MPANQSFHTVQRMSKHITILNLHIMSMSIEITAFRNGNAWTVVYRGNLFCHINLCVSPNDTANSLAIFILKFIKIDFRWWLCSIVGNYSRKFNPFDWSSIKIFITTFRHWEKKSSYRLCCQTVVQLIPIKYILWMRLIVFVRIYK